jgi:hypothetical protein
MNREWWPSFAPKEPEKDEKIIDALIAGDVEKAGGEYVASMSAEHIQEMREEALADKKLEEEERIEAEAREEDRKKFGINHKKDAWEKQEEKLSGNEWKE